VFAYIARRIGYVSDVASVALVCFLLVALTPALRSSPCVAGQIASQETGTANCESPMACDRPCRCSRAWRWRAVHGVAEFIHWRPVLAAVCVRVGNTVTLRSRLRSSASRWDAARLVAGYFRDTWVESWRRHCDRRPSRCRHYWLGRGAGYHFSIATQHGARGRRGPAAVRRMGWDWEHLSIWCAEIRVGNSDGHRHPHVGFLGA